MKKLLVFAPLVLLVSTVASADGSGGNLQTDVDGLLQKYACPSSSTLAKDAEKAAHYTCTPEFDPSSGVAALTFLLGGLAVVRGRFSKSKQG